jgi:hypothetical protein
MMPSAKVRGHHPTIGTIFESTHVSFCLTLRYLEESAASNDICKSDAAASAGNPILNYLVSHLTKRYSWLFIRGLGEMFDESVENLATLFL